MISKLRLSLAPDGYVDVTRHAVILGNGERRQTVDAGMTIRVDLADGSTLVVEAGQVQAHFEHPTEQRSTG